MYQVNQLPDATAAANVTEATRAGRGPVVRAPRRPRQAILRKWEDREQRDGRQGMWLDLYRQGEYSL